MTASQPTEPTETGRLLDKGGAALYALGADTPANRRRIVRMCDAGMLRVVRIGRRGDRRIVRDSIDELLNSAEFESAAP